MSMPRKTIAVLLLTALSLMLLAPAYAAEHGALYIDGAEGVTLTYWIPIGDAAQKFGTLAEHPYFIWLKEQTGVNIEFVHPSLDQMDQQLNLMVASGNYYDMLYNPWYPAGPQAAINDNVFLDLTDYLQLMPNYAKAINTADGSFAAWEWGPEKERLPMGPQPAFVDKLTTAGGNLWCVSQVWGDNILCEAGPLIRKDWLDKLGLQVPQTLEEVEVVLAAFKAMGDDIIPMSLGATGANGSSGAIVSAFDLYPNWFITDGQGTVKVPGWVDPAFRDYLALMADWYAKGYIDPDFVNRDEEGLTALMLSDRLGIHWDSWQKPHYYNEMYTGDQADYEWIAMPLPRKTTDQQLLFRQTYDSSPINYTVVSSSCENPEIACKWLDVQFSKEAFLRQNYGVEGESYMLDENGVPYFLDSYLETVAQDVSHNYTYLYNNGTMFYSTRALQQFTQSNIEEKIAEMQASITWSENAQPVMNIGYVIFDGDGWGEMFTPYVEAETYAMPMVLRFITGAESLDRFEEYRQTAMELGFEEATQKMQAAYDIMNKR